jgi:type II secretory pathway pseudopilin PulG
MSSQFGRGFTIIETMLFLAISGLLIVSMVTITGATINIQRYRDATESFKGVIQDQYGELLSVRNDRDDTWSCTATAQTEEDGSVIRGQSDCMLLGRYMTVEGSDISLYSVIGRQTGTAAGTDVQKLRDNYVLNVSTINVDEVKMEWDTQLAWPRQTNDGERQQTTPRAISMLFIRSPDSGQIYTFTSDTVADTPTPASLAAMIVGGQTIPGQSSRTLCIDSNGLFVNSDQSVYLNAFATGPSSVESLSNDLMDDPASPQQDKELQC